MPLLALRSLYEEQQGADVTLHIDGVSGQPGIGECRVGGAGDVVAPPTVSPLVYGGKLVKVVPHRPAMYRPKTSVQLFVDGVAGKACIGSATLCLTLAARGAIRGRPRIGKAKVGVALNARGVVATPRDELSAAEIEALQAVLIVMDEL